MPWTLSTPFTGIDGVGRGNDQLKYPAEQQVNIFEINKVLIPALQARFPNSAIQPTDIMELPLDEWADADVAWFSPPCQPHSVIGLNLGDKDERSKPFWRTLEVAQELSQRVDRPTKIFLWENAPGILMKKKSGCFFKLLQAAWLENMKNFTPWTRVSCSPMRMGLP